MKSFNCANIKNYFIYQCIIFFTIVFFDLNQGVMSIVHWFGFILYCFSAL